MKSRLKVIRAELNLTQADVASKCGISRATINGIERGTAKPSSDTLLRLSAGLMVPIERIFPDFGVVYKQRIDVS